MPPPPLAEFGFVHFTIGKVFDFQTADSRYHGPVAIELAVVLPPYPVAEERLAYPDRPGDVGLGDPVFFAQIEQKMFELISIHRYGNFLTGEHISLGFIPYGENQVKGFIHMWKIENGPSQEQNPKNRDRTNGNDNPAKAARFKS